MPPKNLLFLIHFFLFFNLILGDCPPNTHTAANNRCLQFLNHAETFRSAEFTCNLLDGQLVSIHNAFDNKFLLQIAGNQFKNANGWWLGGKQTNSTWQWVDGSKFDYNNWEPGEPLYGDGIIQLPVVGQWKSVNTNNTYPFVCEVPPINTAIPPTQCDDQWIYEPVTNKCYFQATNYYQFLTWDETREVCLAFNADLPHIHNQSENNALLEFSSLHGWVEFYLGLWNPNLDGNWRWVDDNSVPVFQPWCTEWNTPLNSNVFADFYNYAHVANCQPGQWVGGIFEEPLSVCAKKPNV